MGNQAPGQTPSSFGPYAGSMLDRGFSGGMAQQQQSGIGQQQINPQASGAAMQPFLSNALGQLTSANSAARSAYTPAVNNLVGGAGNVLGMRNAAMQGGADSPNISDLVRGVGQNVGMRSNIMSGGSAPNAPLGQGAKSKA